MSQSLLYSHSVCVGARAGCSHLRGWEAWRKGPSFTLYAFDFVQTVCVGARAASFTPSWVGGLEEGGFLHTVCVGARAAFVRTVSPFVHTFPRSPLRSHCMSGPSLTLTCGRPNPLQHNRRRRRAPRAPPPRPRHSPPRHLHRGAGLRLEQQVRRVHGRGLRGHVGGLGGYLGRAGAQ